MSTQLELGEQRKAEGHERVTEMNEEWMCCVQNVIARFATYPCTFTSEDVRNACTNGGLALPKSPNAWGAAFSVAAKQGLIRRVGYQKSSLPSAHARVVAVWQGISR